MVPTAPAAQAYRVSRPDRWKRAYTRAESHLAEHRCRPLVWLIGRSARHGHATGMNRSAVDLRPIAQGLSAPFLRGVGAHPGYPCAIALKPKATLNYPFEKGSDQCALSQGACAAQVSHRRGTLHRLQAGRGNLPRAMHRHRGRPAPTGRGGRRATISTQVHLLRPLPGAARWSVRSARCWRPMPRVANRHARHSGRDSCCPAPPCLRYDSWFDPCSAADPAEPGAIAVAYHGVTCGFEARCSCGLRG
jgi:hypothetical protein